MRGIVALVCLLMASPAIAGKTDSTWNPPARFDHAYSGKIRVYNLPQNQVAMECKKLIGWATPKMHGCSQHNDTECIVITVDKTFMGATPKAVLRHEIGHCNGWPGNHPD